MSDATTIGAAEIEAVKTFYAALNAGDIPGAVAPFHADIERVEPVGYPQSGTYRGRAAIREHFAKARAMWAEGACTPERFVVFGSFLIAIVSVRVRLKNEGEWRVGSVGDVFAFRDGQAVFFRTFDGEAQARAWIAGQPAGRTPG